MGSVASRGDEQIEREVVLNEFRSEVPGGFVAFGALVSVNVYLAVLFRPYAGDWPLFVWMVANALVLVLMCAALITVALRKPGDAEILNFWIPCAHVSMTLCNLSVGASIWVLMPHADESLRMFLNILYVWYLVVQMLGATRATELLVSAVVIVLGSLIAYNLVHPTEYSGALSVFLAIFGATLLGLRRLVRAAVIDAVEARALAERRGEALEQALAEVAAQRDAKTRFIASASHDLQQPVQAASLFFEQALASPDARIRSKATRGARLAFTSVQSLLETMLDHLRLEAGAARATLAPVPLARLIREVAIEHGAAAEAAGIRIRAVASDRLVTADVAMLRRALGNLVTNALRHSRGTRILVGARRASPETIALWVIDDGVGIRADGPSPFDDYAQGSAAQGGFGLGLGSARRMARAMGGELDLDPRWTVGAAFRIELRRADPGAMAPDEEAVRCEAA